MRFLCFQYGSIHRDHWPAGLLCQQSRHSCLHQVGEGTLRYVQQRRIYFIIFKIHFSLFETPKL